MIESIQNGNDKISYTTDVLGEVVDTIEYQYNDPVWKDKLTHCDEYGRFGYFYYDEIGNVISIGDTTFTWENGRQLAKIQKPNNNISTYKYNDAGIRTQKDVNGVVTDYYLNGSAIVTQITGTDRMDFFYDDAGNLIGFSLNGANYFYI